ncbi:SIS domain-containing protein [Streptosporangium sp. NBC_01495]|uniref:SIS domain-containing protein n=1 Tax=Streptosporangium sp. NBC_01495 TaxID=2903899 RepID=UPI002E3260A6|nr:SIS domain-containing protein [Streptosporangium sp. NBC_01495]
MTGLLGALARNAGADDTVREIMQQPGIWRDVDGIVTASRAALDGFLQPLVARDHLRVVLTGAGTSGFAGQVPATTLARRLGRRVDAVSTTDIVADPRGCFAEDPPTLLVSFARSGDSPESLAATELAEQCLSEVHHLVITCNEEGRLAREHSGRTASCVLLMPPASNDRGFAMTSSFTGMTLAALLTLGGTAYAGVAERLARTAERITRDGVFDEDIGALLAREPERIVYLGSGALRGLAAESALKALELTGGAIVATSDSALGFRHGPKAVLNERTVVIVYVSNDPYTRRYDLDIIAELRSTMAPGSVIAIGAGIDGAPGEGNWPLHGAEDIEDAALALPAVVCAQLIGLNAAVLRGTRPDNPFPSGEVNRVVRGVTLHRLRH